MPKITVDRQALGSAMAVMRAVAPRKTSIPTLSHLRLSANGDLALSATDLEMSATLRLPCRGAAAEFDALVPVDRLSNHVRCAKGKTVTIAAEGNEVTLDGCAKLVGMDPGEFPAIPDGEGEPAAMLRAAELAEAIPTVAFAVSREVTRYALTGVLLDLGKRRTALVASDGKRLAVRTMSPLALRAEARLIFPRRALDVLATLASGVARGGRVEILLPPPEVHEGKEQPPARIGFRMAGALLNTRLIEGTFPDWKAVTPKHKGEGWTFAWRALAEALVSVRLATTEKSRAVRFRLGRGRCELYAKTVDVGDARAEVAADGDGKAEIAVNSDFVLDYLKALPKDAARVTMKATNPGVGTTWHGPRGHVYVLMPLTDAKFDEK
jgi:DNA polymerase-3 subunit beta